MKTSTKTSAERQVEIACGYRRLAGILNVPPNATGIVVFAHGSGSGRQSPRNQFVARVLQQAGLATLLIDLLEAQEAGDREKVFDIVLLAERLQSAANWVTRQPKLASLKLGYFGASTGAGEFPGRCGTSSGNCRCSRLPRRPSRFGWRRPIGRASTTLLIVGGNDDVVVDLNEQAAASLECEHQLVVVRHRALIRRARDAGRSGAAVLPSGSANISRETDRDRTP